MTTDHSSVDPGRLTIAMLASLAALMLVSLGFAVTAPQGLVLAVFKLVALAFVFLRVRAANVYSMQWSSMFILLFVAEGTVRAASDPRPGSVLGLVEAIAAAVYFVAVLAFLRPFKKRAKGARDPARSTARGSS